MDKAEVLERVREVVSDMLGLAVADVEADERLVEDLEVDKPQVLELLEALEEEFDIELDEEELWARSTVGEVAELVWEVVDAQQFDEEDEDEDYDDYGDEDNY